MEQGELCLWRRKLQALKQYHVILTLIEFIWFTGWSACPDFETNMVLENQTKSLIAKLCSAENHFPHSKCDRAVSEMCFGEGSLWKDSLKWLQGVSVSWCICHPAHAEISAQAVQVHNYLLASLTTHHTLCYGLLDKLAPSPVCKLTFSFFFFHV